LKGNVHPLALPRYDQGAVSDSFPAERMLLVLQRSPERETALQQFLHDAHAQGNPSYHKWLTPEQFGELYGPDDSEIATVTSWLQKRGFSVARVTKGKTAVEFSGTAGQLRDAFSTEIHSYLVNGETHHANNRDPQIPAALAPVIVGITPINDFRPAAQLRVLGKAGYDRKTHRVQPEWTISSSPPELALAPGDFAVQYDLNPLYTAGINGNGVTIGIIGASNVYPNVVANYRSFFGLPASMLNIVIDGLDPGPSATVNHGNWAEVESFLDVEVSGAVAPGATVNLYTAADTTVQSGLLLAAQRAVDDDVTAVLSTSYGACEQSLGSSGNQFWAAL
jgi:subtilase family serine protease